MVYTNDNIKKICNFYVSDWHLVTMLLPYINKKINEQAQIATILENNVEENVKKLVEKLNLKNKEKILNLNWNNKLSTKEIFNNINNKEIVIIINGTRDYITRQNIKLLRYIQKNKIENKIKIINCNEIGEFNGSIEDILDKHDKILNTSGEKEIDEIFIDYKRKNIEDKDRAVV